MKFYLSSFGLGNNPSQLVTMMGESKRIGYIPNGMDAAHTPEERVKILLKRCRS